MQATFIETPVPIPGYDERQENNAEIRPSIGCGIGILLKTSRASVAAVIRDIRPHGLIVVTHQACPEGNEVSIEFGAASLAGQVVSCGPAGNVYELSIAFPNGSEHDERAEARFPITQEVQIYAGSSGATLNAMSTNLSAHGICLEMSAPLKPGETIMAESASSEAFGIVRHCRRLDSGSFQTGVEVFHVMPKER